MKVLEGLLLAAGAGQGLRHQHHGKGESSLQSLRLLRTLLVLQGGGCHGAAHKDKASEHKSRPSPQLQVLLRGMLSPDDPSVPAQLLCLPR